MTNNWVISKQSGILVNLDNLADILCKKQDGAFAVVGYTPQGFGIVIHKGSQEECSKIKEMIENKVTAQVL